MHNVKDEIRRNHIYNYMGKEEIRLVIHLYEIIEALALHGCTLHFTGSLFNVFVCSIGYICVYLYISLLNYICLVR